MTVTMPDRVELRRLVDELPDQDVKPVLADVRRRVHPVAPDGRLPRSLGAGTWIEGVTDAGRRADDLLAKGIQG